MIEDTSPKIKRLMSPPPEPRRRIRAVHWHVSIWTLVSIGLIASFLVLASMSLTGRVVTLPDWVSQKVLTRMNAALPTGTLSLRRVQFGVTERGRPKLRLVDVGLRDASGLEIALLNQIEGGFKLGPALMGRIEPTILRLQGAQATIRRFSDGSLALSVGATTNASGDVASVLDEIDKVLTEGLLAQVERIEARDLTVTLEDARSGRLWQVTDGQLEVVPQARVIDTTVRFDVFNQTEELAHTVISFRSARASSEASIAARFSNAAARDIAAQTPALAFLSVIDAPISGALRSTISQEGKISELAGTMEIGSGALSPTPGAQPAQFDGAKIYIDYDPEAQRIDFQGANLRSELGTAEGEGHVYLADFNGGWPGSLIGQVTLNRAVLNPRDLFAEPLTIDRGLADIRVRLSPFAVDIGQAVVERGPHRYEVEGRLGATEAGWSAALDARFETADKAEIMALWPLPVESNTRGWVARNIHVGEAFNGALFWRKAPGGPMTMNGTFGMRMARATVMEGFPPVDMALGYAALEPNSFTITGEAATITAPDGSVMDLTGTSYQVPDLLDEEGEGVVRLRMTGPLRGALSLLDQEPLAVFDGGAYGPDLARGAVEIGGTIRFPTAGETIPVEAVAYDLQGSLTDVRSDVLIDGKLLSADRLSLEASHEGIRISGPAEIGQAAVNASWAMPLDNGVAGTGTVDGTLEIGAAALREFGLEALEPMVEGRARAQFTLTLPPGGVPPRLELRSDLIGLGMNIPGTGWSKLPGSRGVLEIRARLGDRALVDELVLTAPELSATGRVTTAEGGGLGEAQFERVQIGGWLDGPIVITGRGSNLPVAITMSGGSIDLRTANLGGIGTDGAAAAGPRMPLTLALDRLIVTDGIQIENLRADLDMSGGLRGGFTGKVVGGGRIEGTVAQTDAGAAFRITSNRAGSVLRGAGVFETARGGNLELILAPTAATGVYEGEFMIEDVRVTDASGMAELLSAVSVVGLLEQLRGEGLRFQEVEGRFRLSPNALTLYRSSAVGASVGISMDGYFDMAAQRVDMQGVISPFYLVNSLGRFLSPRDGEGLVGFNFDLVGDFDAPDVEVNPLSIFTPGAFREIFRRAPPTQPEE